MINTWAICKREFAAYFLTPIGYVVCGIFALIAGLGFRALLLEYARMSQAPTDYGFTTVPDFGEFFLHPYLVFAGMIVVFLSPLITMRLMAEETHRGTAEQLFTLPLRDREIVFGKYLAALAMLAVMMLVVGVHLAIVAYFVDIEPVALVCGLVGVFLMGAAFLSLGFFVSCLTRTQITAATVTFGLIMALFFAGNMAENLPEAQEIAVEGVGPLQPILIGGYRVIRTLLQQLAADAHLEELTLGVVRPQDVVYHVLFAAFFLFLTFRALESRNWRA
ncbi:MAG TPA: ABC transporter permease subunit [Candidatus Hydrogenedentes bacterium]|nr:ABC transporter permease subunit [Candidatus Hydrogenedentota bacterium]HNT87863.1 ABC transporter permease subunit [Candidatus Hydrogenedentota bacterium]